VDHTKSRKIVIPLTPHPAAANALYVPQGTSGVNLFENFKEKHMETSSLPRYNTRAVARQQSPNQAQLLAPRVFCRLTFTNTQGCHVAPKQATTRIPMANAVINKDTGASLEHHQLIQDETKFTKQQQTSLDAWPKVLGGELKDPTQSSLSHAKQYPKRKL
jgi:hypothetical protein